jgi:hypothetical protein
MSACKEKSNVQGALVGVEHGFVHGFRKRRMRKDSGCEFGVGGFERARDRVALDQLRHFGADHMRTEKLSGIGVENRFDESLRFTERNRLAVADIRKTPNL